MARLNDFGALSKDSNVEKLEDVEGQDLQLTDARLTTGDFGEFAILQLIDSTGKPHTITTGAFLVLDAVKGWLDSDRQPADVVFTRKGRTWTMK